MPSLPKKVTPRQKWLEALRKKASEELATTGDQPLTEKDRLDQATLDAVDATKH